MARTRHVPAFVTFNRRARPERVQPTLLRLALLATVMAVAGCSTQYKIERHYTLRREQPYKGEYTCTAMWDAKLPPSEAAAVRQELLRRCLEQAKSDGFLTAVVEARSATATTTTYAYSVVTSVRQSPALQITLTAFNAKRPATEHTGDAAVPIDTLLGAKKSP
ncbi:hypothetical protein SAMN02745126_05061 [Enhydrobacter aerosaccus]|uniref:Lipoprotein n=1 Tax=Enhydrobacter aerosaccus TaxID=225324 RepID=A0A1T4SS06_9HYPH|nr:hypothetical protein [Enhydrobacter aerosaccus]SKA30967.1 hypothetical protein SAMN02745126_05061 [Enhydrobacter aerosaccus]